MVKRNTSGYGVARGGTGRYEAARGLTGRPEFIRLWTGQTISLLGSHITGLALLCVVLSSVRGVRRAEDVAASPSWLPS